LLAIVRISDPALYSFQNRCNIEKTSSVRRAVEILVQLKDVQPDGQAGAVHSPPFVALHPLPTPQPNDPPGVMTTGAQELEQETAATTTCDPLPVTVVKL
jgi:hypothetical protein